MGRTHTTDDFFTLEVFSSMYLDWGLSVTHALHGQLFYNPSALGRESCGTKPNPEKYEDWDEAERAALDGDDDAFVSWTVSEWSEWLADEADDLLEVALPEPRESYHPMFGGRGIPAWMQGLVWEFGRIDDSRSAIRIHAAPGVELSVVAGHGLYSDPRHKVAWDLYSALEVGIIANGLCRPETVGLTTPDLANLFEPGLELPVAGYVEPEVIRAMADEIKAAHLSGAVQKED
jgi:hypothetical protein